MATHQLLHAENLIKILAISMALILGMSIGNEKWLYVLAIAAVPLVVSRPIEVSMGAYALLVPFDGVAALEGRTGTTLTWYVGAAAAGILLLVGLAGHRLDVTRRGTVAWGLLVGWS